MGVGDARSSRMCLLYWAEISVSSVERFHSAGGQPQSWALDRVNGLRLLPSRGPGMTSPPEKHTGTGRCRESDRPMALSQTNAFLNCTRTDFPGLESWLST